MDILWVTSGSPYPPDQGNRIVIFNRIKGLARRGHNIHLLACVTDKEDLEYENYMEGIVSSVNYFLKSKGYLEYLHSVLHGFRPYNIYINYDERLEELGNKIIGENNIDVIFTDHIYASGYSFKGEAIQILGVHNLEYQWFWDSAKLAIPAPRSVAYTLEAGRMRLYEQNIYNQDKYDSYTFVSTTELKEVRSSFPPTENKLWLSPIGIDVDRFQDVSPSSLTQDAPTMVFTGSMGSRLNTDAVRWFTSNVFPMIREEIPNARFIIVGKNPSKEVKELGKFDGVTVTGAVEATEPYIVGADLIVIPLRGGAGVKIKLLEGLAAKNTVLTTDAGISGTNIHPGREVLHSNGERGFASKAISALNNPDEYKNVRKRGYKYVKDNHHWKNIIDDMETRLESMIV